MEVLPLLDPASLRPLPAGPQLSAALAGPLSTITSARDGLSSVAGAVAPDAPVDVDGRYALTIGVARDELGAEDAPVASSAPDTLVAAGENSETIRQSVLRYLPQVDAPIEQPFIEPPHPPGGQLPDPDRGGPDAQTPLDDRGKPTGPVDTGGGASGGGTSASALTAAAVREAVRQDYLTLLHREPDEPAWTAWVEQVTIAGHSLAWVTDRIVESDEYKAKHPPAASPSVAPGGGRFSAGEGLSDAG